MIFEDELCNIYANSVTIGNCINTVIIEIIQPPLQIRFAYFQLFAMNKSVEFSWIWGNYL